MESPVVGKAHGKADISGMQRHFKDYQPDMSPREAHPLPGAESRHRENTSISHYVWLPVEWEGEKPIIRWKEEWRI